MRLLPEEILTARLRLRGPAPADAAAIFHAYAQDPQVTRYLVWTPHTHESTVRDFVAACIDAWVSGNRMPYVITSRDSDSLLGMIDARILGTKVEMGYVLARAEWGKGYMPEAVQAISKAALDRPEFFRVQASCDVENVPSQRVLEKSGFTREARLERYMVHPNVSPEPRPSFMYAKWR